MLNPTDRTASRTNVMLRMGASIETATTAAGAVYTVRDPRGRDRAWADLKPRCRGGSASAQAETLAVSGVHAGTVAYPASGAVAVAGEGGVFAMSPGKSGRRQNKEDLGQQDD